MFKFRFFSLVVISMMLILGLSAGSVLAKTGGVKVDDDQNCNSPDKEDNTITASPFYIWLNLSNKNASNPGTVCVEFDNHDTGQDLFVDVIFAVPAAPPCTKPYPIWFVASVDAGGLGIDDGDITVTVYDAPCPPTAANNVISGDTFELNI